MIVETQLRRLVEDRFEPVYLQLENESHQHSVPADSETHFRLLLVSKRFTGLRKVARHQLIYQAASELLAGPIHALSMFLYDPSEWREREQPPAASPDCLGGSRDRGREPGVEASLGPSQVTVDESVTDDKEGSIDNTASLRGTSPGDERKV